ncbi:MAG: tRNA 4-thiouridine(8) synthase ThiI, partial [Lachnospiraceae bacterium]|nr:tRNA 4-thiouridine(8) synthase ThiI [Lachnospiraceae bacterium]
ERAKEKVVDLAKIVSAYTGPIKLHVINFTDIQMAIYQKCPPDELTIIMRRYMMRIAEHIALENGCMGLVTGESIGQVASQTMQSLMCTNEVCTLPVYRPLIAFDKQDIVDISEKINTYETSVLPYEDCCTIFVAEHPVTKPIPSVIEKHEHNLDDCIDEMYKKAIEEREIIEIK